ncbi:MAG: hypothetical protein ABJM26_06330 [Anderseniella sp.]
MLDKLYGTSSTNTLCAFALAATAAITLNSGHARSASDTESMLVPGDSIVTGFSGHGGSQQDRIIDLDGPSAQVLSLRNFAQGPRGSLSDAAIKHRITAGQVGQVFAIALDDGQDQAVPDIYLGSTSYFGLEIVVPDRNGDGKADRVKIGHPDAQWMPGQFGPNGNPGSIWRVNGTTGEVTLFATLPNNSGAGVGDIVFDKVQRQFLVSDLDTGLIYRIGLDGTIIDSFNHGTDGRSAAGLAVIEDDGRTADISSSAFNGADPATWGHTQKHRRIAGMAQHQGRLYYAVADGPQIWSVGLGEDGSFSSDARLELVVADLPGTGPVTDMLFDKSGRLYLAQRGEQRASDEPSSFAEPGTSAIVRYSPTGNNDAPVWTKDEDGYAIGTSGIHNQSNGGIALGYQHDQSGALQHGSPDATLWATGDQLLSGGSDTASAQLQPDVHGLQGNDVSLLRPLNTPPNQSYFIDYDGKFGDPEKSGHMGDVEIWQSGDGQIPQSDNDLLASPDAESWPVAGFDPPLDEVPPDLPPEFPPPETAFSANLKLTKQAVFKKCKAIATGWKCRYKIKIRNTGPDTYVGPIRISEHLVNPGGATLNFSSSWNCWTVGAADYRCRRPNVVLPKGASVSLTAIAKVPASFARCRLKNVAKILRAPGGSRWNTNPQDDRGTAVAKVPGDNCGKKDPPPKPTNLSLKKKLLSCGDDQLNVLCSYLITVKNTGPNPYNAPLVVRDRPQAGATSVQFGITPWSCAPGAGNGYRCEYGVANLAPGDTVTLLTWMKVPKQVVRNKNCRVINRARILEAPGGSLLNSDPSDDKSKAVAQIPEDMCGQDLEKEPRPLQTNLKIEKQAGESCQNTGGNRWCVNWQIKVTNTGPGSFNDVIRFREQFPAGAVLTPLSSGLSCTGSVCQSDSAIALTAAGSVKSFYVSLSGPASVARRLKCRVTNQVKIIAPAGIPNKNTDMSDDKAHATATLPPSFCERPSLDNTPAPGPGTVKPPSDKCRPGFSPVHGRCQPNVSTCPRGLKKVSASRVRKLRHKGWTVRRVRQAGRALWCGKPADKPTLKCRKTWKQVVSKHRIPKGWKSYRTGRDSAAIWCAKKVRKQVSKCRRPARWNGKTCVCPGHRKWNGKRCVTPKVRSSRKCKPGFVGRKPNCRRISAPKRNRHRNRPGRNRH